MTTEEALAGSLGIQYTISRVAIGRHEINYLRAGQGAPLVLLHGANFGWGVWYPNIPVLAKHFTVYAVDLPGAGRSSRVDYRTLDPALDLYDVVVQWMNRLGITGADVIGCSIGGWIAMKLALEHAEMVKRLVILNSVGLANYMGRGERMIGLYSLANIIAKTVLRPTRNNKNIERFLRGIFYNKNIELRPEFIEYFYETMATSHNLLFISRLTALEDTFLLENELPRISQPTAIIWGKNDHIIPLEKNQASFSRIPRVEISLIENAGHIPSLEQPAAFNEQTLAFLGT